MNKLSVDVNFNKALGRFEWAVLLNGRVAAKGGDCGNPEEAEDEAQDALHRLADDLAREEPPEDTPALDPPWWANP